MIPAWATRRTPEEQERLEREELAREVEEWRQVSPQELGRRMAQMAVVATASAWRSPFWEAANEPEPRPPEAEARWMRLVAEFRDRAR